MADAIVASDVCVYINSSLNKDCGIYAITSPSGKMYIGQAVSFKSRWSAHVRQLRRNKHHCLGLQNAFNKYGEDDLAFSVIEIVHPDRLDEREQAHIDSIPRNMLYNRSLDAASPMRGLKHSEQTKNLMSLRQMGENNPNWKKSPSKEVRKKISLGVSGERNAWWGRKLPAETIAKMAAAKFGKKSSEETRRKIGLSRVNFRHTEESKAKISSSISGEKNPIARSVVCVETGDVFPTIRNATAWLVSIGFAKAAPSAISLACSGGRPRAYGYTWRYCQDR